MKSFLRSNLWIVLSCLTIPPIAGTVVALTLQNHVPQSANQNSDVAISEPPAIDPTENAKEISSATMADSPDSVLTHSQGGIQPSRQPDNLTEFIEPPLTAQNSDFNCDTPQFQLEMNYCAGLDYQRADERLNLTYGDLMAVIPETRREKLIAAEQAWIEYRDATCAFERSKYEGGSIEPMIYHSCMARLTEDQTLLLESYLDEYNY